METFQKLFNFDNIGKKIKNFTKWYCWIMIILCWIAAIVGFIILLDESEEVAFLPLIGGLVAPFIIWIGSWVMYAFGELVDKTCDIAAGNRPVVGGAPVYSNPNAPAAPVVSKTKAAEMNKRIAQIEDLRSKGLITEEEYREAIAKVQ